jgi:soluble lytic murein transglycosylase
LHLDLLSHSIPADFEIGEGLVLHGSSRRGSRKMLGLGRLSVTVGFLFWILFGSTLSMSGPLGDEPGGADPVRSLTEAQRTAARALGEARGHLDAGRLEAARVALAQTHGVAGLSGYADLVRVRILMQEGESAEAYRKATLALEASPSSALRAALGVLQGEALAMSGDSRAAELAWSEVLGTQGAEDEAVRQSIELSIVASRQRTGSMDTAIDPLVLLDQNYGDVGVASEQVPAALMSASLVLDRATAALDAGHPGQALELYDQAISKKLDPAQRRAAQMGRARALFRERKYEGAVKAFGALLPDLEARFWRARSLARSGEIEKSIEEFTRVSQATNEELASWALYLKGTLHEDRGEMEAAIDAFRSAAQYAGYPERVRDALWREGWAQYRTKRYAEARSTLDTLAARTDDVLARLRPRYWAARASALAGAPEKGRKELADLAHEFPLTYYGWRAQERLALEGDGLVVTQRNLAEGTRRVDDEAIERVALLIEAGLDDMARSELRFAARRARGFVDRTQVGILLARVGDYHRANELVVTAYSDSLARGLQPGREALWWLSWPPAYRETIREILPSEASIEPELVSAIMREESHYRVDARSSVGALGLLQLMPSTAAQLAREKGIENFESEDLFDPRTNIILGAAYLDQLGTRFDGRMSAAIGSYNAGPRRVSSWLRGGGKELEDDVWVENIPYDQTRSYVKRVLRSLHAYKSFYR